MRIACISDTHGMLPPIEMFSNHDAVIHAGDIGPDIHVKEWIQTSFIPWVHNLGIPFYGCYGNHDYPSNWEEGALKTITLPYGGSLGNFYGKEINGFLVWFSAFSPTFGSWARMRQDRTLVGEYNKIPPNTKVIVSHSPPAGNMGGITLRGDEAGSLALLARCYELPHLDTVVCGHIHEGWGTYSKFNYAGDRELRSINCSYVDSMYEPQDRYKEIIL